MALIGAGSSSASSAKNCGGLSPYSAWMSSIRGRFTPKSCMHSSHASCAGSTRCAVVATQGSIDQFSQKLKPSMIVITCGTMTQPNGIEVEGLVRVFKNGPRAVDGIHLEVAPGEIYGFLGPNGAGKSTTVLMLTTLLPPTAGTAAVAGYDIVKDGAAVRDVIGVALQ